MLAADAVVAVSEGMRRDVLACYPDVDPSRVRVLHNGIDTAEYAPDPGTSVLSALGVDSARPYVIWQDMRLIHQRDQWDKDYSAINPPE